MKTTERTIGVYAARLPKWGFAKDLLTYRVVRILGPVKVTLYRNDPSKNFFWFAHHGQLFVAGQERFDRFEGPVRMVSLREALKETEEAWTRSRKIASQALVLEQNRRKKSYGRLWDYYDTEGRLTDDE